MEAFRALTISEMRLFVRDPLATVFALVFPFAMLLLLAAVFGDTPPDDQVDGMLVFRGVSGDDYYVAASVGVVGAAIGLLVMPVALAGYRERGILRRFRASGLSTRSLFGAYVLVGLAVSVAGSLVMIAASTLLYGTQLPDDVVGVACAILLSVFCFMSIGFLLAGLIPTARAAQGIGLMLFLTLWMISGTAPPLAVLPEAIRNITRFQPLSHMVIAIQDPWFGFGWNLEKLGIIAATTLVAGAVAIWRFRWG